METESNSEPLPASVLPQMRPLIWVLDDDSGSGLPSIIVLCESAVSFIFLVSLACFSMVLIGLSEFRLCLKVASALLFLLPARPMIATLPLRSTLNNGTVLPKKPSGSLPSPSGPGSRKDTSSPASKR